MHITSKMYISKLQWCCFWILFGVTSAQLSSNFYSSSCPNALSTIQSAVQSAVNNESRMGASLLRLHFHDCFVNASPLNFYSSWLNWTTLCCIHCAYHLLLFKISGGQLVGSTELDSTWFHVP